MNESAKEKDNFKESSKNHIDDNIKNKDSEFITISKEEYEKLKKERDEYLENWKRERAEKVNYKNQVDKRMKEQLNREGSRVLIQLLQVSDNFARALEKSKGEIPDAHYEGFRLIHEEILKILKKEGVEEIKIEPGKTVFDPVYHEALYTIETTEYPTNTIAEVVFRGYIRNGFVIKPAKVAVYKQISQKQDMQRSDSQKASK